MPHIPPSLLVVVSLTMIQLLDSLHTNPSYATPSDLTNIHAGFFLAYYIHIDILRLVKVIALTAFSFGQL